MRKSKVDICNLALAYLGAEAIRSFEDNNVRSRLCDVTFDITKDHQLSTFDWPFARKYAVLSQVDPESITLPEGEYAYSLPNDCITPRYVGLETENIKWRVEGGNLISTISTEGEVPLHYTAQIADTFAFSDPFINVLAIDLATRVGLPITKNKKLVDNLLGRLVLAETQAWDTEANKGNTYRRSDDDHNKDTFVTGGTVAIWECDERCR
jgi:hypothetical protein